MRLLNAAAVTRDLSSGFVNRSRKSTSTVSRIPESENSLTDAVQLSEGHAVTGHA